MSFERKKIKLKHILYTFIDEMLILKIFQVSLDFDPWTVMFIIGGMGYIIPAIFFCFFGSARIQKWNEIISLNDSQDKKMTEINPITGVEQTKL